MDLELQVILPKYVQKIFVINILVYLEVARFHRLNKTSEKQLQWIENIITDETTQNI